MLFPVFLQTCLQLVGLFKTSRFLHLFFLLVFLFMFLEKLIMLLLGLLVQHYHKRHFVFRQLVYLVLDTQHRDSFSKNCIVLMTLG